MQLPLTPAQRERGDRFREFAAKRVAPFAAAWDQAQRMPDEVLRELGQEGFFGASLPEAVGGQGWDAVTFGLLHEAIGRHDSALAGFLTIQSMVAMALNKWGAPAQKAKWLPGLASGEMLGSFALTEPDAGSDLAGLKTELSPAPGGGYVLRGEKKWVSGSQHSDVFLVFGKLSGKPVACLVPRQAAGFEIEPIKDLMGFRAAGLGRLIFKDVPVAEADLVGKPGFAFSHVAPVGLQWGRISTACSAWGLLRGCAEEAAGYAARRHIAGKPAAELGMVQSLIARMATDLEAAGWLCWAAGDAEDQHSSRAYGQAFTAKYFASQAAVRAAGDAVQIHGAAGVHASSPVSRFYRAAKIMEIIEGSTQVHEVVISQNFLQERRA